MSTLPCSLNFRVQRLRLWWAENQASLARSALAQKEWLTHFALSTKIYPLSWRRSRRILRRTWEVFARLHDSLAESLSPIKALLWVSYNANHQTEWSIPLFHIVVLALLIYFGTRFQVHYKLWVTMILDFLLFSSTGTSTFCWRILIIIALLTYTREKFMILPGC